MMSLMLLIRFIDLFTFPMVASGINKRGMSLWCDLAVLGYGHMVLRENPLGL